MPSKHKPSLWQRVAHKPSQSYADSAPAHPSRPHRASPYGAPSVAAPGSLTAGALAAAQQQHARAESSRRRESAPSQQQHQPQPGPRKQSLQYNYAAERSELVDDDDDEGAGGSEGPGASTQWVHPSLRKGGGARSDIGPSSASAPLGSDGQQLQLQRKKSTRRKVSAQSTDTQDDADAAPKSKPRRASASVDQRPMIVEHHHHHYHTASPTPGVSSPVFSSSPSPGSSQVGSQVGGSYASPRAQAAPPTFNSAVVLPTPPSSDVGVSSSGLLGRDFAPSLGHALLAAPSRAPVLNGIDSDSDEDAFYTPRSSMSFVSAVEDEPGHPAATPEPAHAALAAPTLTFQPPTPTTFPLAGGDTRPPVSPGVEPGVEKNLFSEYSFHPDQVGRQQSPSPPPPPQPPQQQPQQQQPQQPLQVDSPEKLSPDLEQPPRPPFAREGRSSTSPTTTPPSSSPRMAAQFQDEDDAYSGVLLYALQEEDEGPSAEPALPPVPPRLPSIPHISPLATPSLTNLSSNPISAPPTLSGLHPGSYSRKAESIRSAASSSSRYSQTSYASYASELDVPTPRLVPSATSLVASNTSSPLSSPARPTPASSDYSRGHTSASPSRSSSGIKSPGFTSGFLDSPPTAPSSVFSAPIKAGGQQQLRLTPFLPRPTSMLISSFDMAGSYPSAPASVVSDSGHRPRKAHSASNPTVPSAGAAASEQRRDRPPSIMSYTLGSVGGSDVGLQRRRLMSEGAGMRDVRSAPQVMGDVARGQGGTSLSGGAGYSAMTLPKAVYRPTKSPARYSNKVAYDTMGMPDTTMATIMVSSSTRRPSTPSLTPSTSMSSILRRNSTSSATPAHLLPTPTISVQYSAHTPPPKKLSSTGVLVRIWAVAVDGYDALAARDAAPGFIPGRSFVGKVVQWGDGCEGMFSKGEFVFGLRDLKRSGALSEFIVIERRYLAKAPPVTASGLEEDDSVDERGLTLEDVAALPLLGVTAHRAVGGIHKGSRALVLLSSSIEQGAPGSAAAVGASDWGVGVLACQELIARGVIVVLQVSEDQGEAWARQHIAHLREGHVRVGEPAAVVHAEHEGSFDLVLDCVGGRRVYDASRRILTTGGQFTTLKGDESATAIPSAGSATNYRSLRRAFVKKDRKHIDYRVISPAGAGPVVDFMGEDVRDILEWIARERIYRPVRVAKVVPFERASEAFAVRPRAAAATGGGGAKVAALQGSYECEEQVWGIRLVS